MAGSSICTLPFPQDVPSSEQYRTLFNREARKKGYPITWVGDKNGGLTNIPDPSLGEITIDEGRKDFDLTPEIICELRDVVEGKRLRVGTETRNGLYVTPSHTLDPEILNVANASEQQWLRFVSDRLQEASLAQFGDQANYDYASLSGWMSQHGDANARWHFSRMRVSKTPPLNPELDTGLKKEFGIPEDSETESPNDYGNNFPWFQEAPRFNTLFPENFTQEDKDYISQTFKDPDHPIRLPWTVVEQVSAGSMFAHLKNNYTDKNSPDTIEYQRADGNVVSWLVRGRDNQWVVVTNMAYHPKYQAYLREFAKTLREASSLPPVNGTTLNPEFRQYTLKAAEYLERGEFQKLLEADLDQTQGNLFFTYFPHEGYWPDGMKFPYMLEIGIRDPGASKMSPAEAEVFQFLEDRAAAVAKKHGLKHEARMINTREIAKSAVMVWIYRSGGFMRAYHREPAGHDYPKRVYKGINLHRTVVLMDSVFGAAQRGKLLYRDLLDPKNQLPAQESDIVDFIVWHEGTHGTGARAETPTQSGRSMSDVYGDFWGLIAEPLADAGSILSVAERHRRGLISTDERNRRFRSGLAWQAGRVIPKNLATGPYFGNPDAPHLVGSNMLLGFCLKSGSVQLSEDGQALILDEEKFAGTVETFFEQLTLYSLTDDLEGFKRFALDAINAAPDNALARVLQVKSLYSKVPVLNRNPNRQEGNNVVK